MTGPPATICVEADISWDGDATWTGPYDDITGDAVAETGVTVTHGRQNSVTLSPPAVSSGSVTVHNEDGKYSQERADSPVYQRVVPGRPVRYRVAHGTRDLYRAHTLYRETDPYRGEAHWPLGRHIVHQIAQTTDLGNSKVSFQTIGYETILTRSLVTVPVQTNIRTDQAVTLLLNAAGWPADARDISVGDTQLLYWWADERSPWDAMLELLAAEGPGTFYVDRAGVFHWENRNYRAVADRSVNNQATFSNVVAHGQDLYRTHTLYREHDLYRGRTTGLWFTRLTYDPAFVNIKNRATYATKRRALGALAPIWSYGATLSPPGGDGVTFIVKPSDPFQNAVTPVSPTDYTVAGGTVSVGLSAPSGLVAFLTVTATSGTPVVTGLQLRAQPLTVVSETTAQNSVNASSSIAKFSPIPGANIPLTLSVSGWPEIDPAAATAVCNAWISRYMVPRPLVTINVRNADGAHVRQQLERMPSDRIRVVVPTTGAAADMWINSTELRVYGANGRIVEAVLSGERCDELTGSLWDAGLWDSAIWGE